MGKIRIHKKDVARSQLETAVKLFLSGKDRSSVITLAGAASGILDALVRDSGKQSFVDYARNVHREMVGHTPKRQSYNHHINKVTGVIAHKHMSNSDPESIEMDLDKMAFDSLARGLADYVVLNGQEEFFVKAFFQWAWEHMDGQTLMEEYMNLPEKMKRD